MGDMDFNFYIAFFVSFPLFGLMADVWIVRIIITGMILCFHQ